jgi:DNA-binding transcriptional LysR family regulator
VLIREARAVLRALEQAQEKVDALHGLSTGSLTIGTYATFVSPVGLVAAEFRAKYPGVALRFPPPGDSDRILEMVTSGECDVGFAVMSSAADLATAREQVEVVPVAVDESVALVPSSSPLGRSTDPVDLHELATLPMIAARRGHRGRSMMEDMFARQGIAVDVTIECEDYNVAFDLVGSGLGAVAATRGALPADLGTRITVRALRPRRQWPVVMMHRREAISPAGAEFEKLAMVHFNDLTDDAGLAEQLLRRLVPPEQH